MSRGLLNRAELIVFEADFVGKDYLADGLFVLNTIPINEISNFAYIVKSLDV